MSRSVRNRQLPKPGGIEELAQQHAEAALATLVEVCGNRDAPAAARVAAAVAILDRGYGKARQAVEHSGEVSQRYVVHAPPPVENTEEWLARYAPQGTKPV